MRERRKSRKVKRIDAAGFASVVAEEGKKRKKAEARKQEQVE